MKIYQLMQRRECFNTYGMERKHNQHWQFLEDELIAEIQNFEKVYSSRAQKLLLEEEKMYVGQFVGFRNGQMLIKFPNTRSVPRKREFLFCMLLPADLRLYRNWGDKTYEDLYGARYKGSDAVCIWHDSSDDPRCTLVGFSDVDLDFANFIADTPGLLLVFAPKRPPIEYLANLQAVIEDVNNLGLINLATSKRIWSPELIREDEIDVFIKANMENKLTTILQGPPGTGKTYLIAKLCHLFSCEGKSVLVTALTNRALMEVAEKETLCDLLTEGKVSKTNLTANEVNELPTLSSATEIDPAPGTITLATFYKASDYARYMEENSKFDIVIMDEASQAFTAMFAACCKMGGKQLWVGDTKQMPPIVLLSQERILRNNYTPYIEGFQFVADHSSEPVYQLTATRRYGKRAAEFTGVFYNGSLETKVGQQDILIPEKLKNYLSPNGGPAYIPINLNVGDLRPLNAIDYIVSIVRDYLAINPKKEIAVLAHQVKTVNAIQMELSRNGINTPNVIADTVARVQGLTTDIVIYLLVNSSYMFSLEPKLFNVATSRAREHTIILGDKSLFSGAKSHEVQMFLDKLNPNQSV